jgi:hypothetical protein
MEVNPPVSDAMKIRESAGGRSNGGSGVIINDKIMQVFISVAFLTIIIPTICGICVGTSCHTMASKSSPICTIGCTQHIIWAVFLAIFPRYNVCLFILLEKTDSFG